MINIGEIVSTHGIKGELKIISNFPYKEKIFQIGKKLIIDNKEYTIRTYRVHKNYDMVTLDNYNNINEVIHLLKKEVYVKKNTLELNDDEILDEDLLKYSVETIKKEIGKVKEIFWASPKNKIMRIQLDKEKLIPFNSPQIKEINKKEKKIIVEILDEVEVDE